MRTRQRFVHGQTAWMLITILALAALGALSLELFFVISLIGFLIMIELTAPLNLTPAWHARLKWLVVIGLLIFGSLVVRRILEILPPGVL